MKRISVIIISAFVGLSMIMPGTVALAHSGTNHAPVLRNPGNFTVDTNDTFTRTITVSDQDGDRVTTSMVSGPVNSSWNAATRQFRFTPSNNQEGNSYSITLRAVDQHGKSSQMTFRVTVDDDADNDNDNDNNSSGNRAPIIRNPGNRSVDEDEAIRVSISAYDPDDDDFTISGVNAPVNSTWDAAEQEWTFRPSSNQDGRYTFTNRAVDEHGKSSQMTFYITVDGDGDNDNEDLDWSTFGTQTLVIGESFARSFTVDDDDNDIDYSASNLPSGASYDSNGRFRWTPRSNQEGVWNITFRAELDGDTSKRSVKFNVVDEDDIDSDNGDSPIFTSNPVLSAVVGQVYQYDVNASNPGSGTLTYRIVTGPTGAFINAQSGFISWVPTSAQRGSNFFQIAVANRDWTSYQNFSVFVSGGTVITNPPVVNPPVVSETLDAFNIRFTTDTNNNVIVSWDTNKNARAEVLYGFASQATNSRGQYNYTFTTGQLPEITTRHEVNLGQLTIGSTYYVRLVSRTLSETDITSELIVVPVENTTGVTTENPDQNTDGTASAFDTLGDFFTGPWFFLLLLLIILGLLIYLLTHKDKGSVRQSFELHS